MPSVMIIKKRDLPRLIPKRAEDAHKQAGGKCLIIAGSEGMWGACYLCARSATRIGAGYVYLSADTKNLTEHPDFVSSKITAHMDLSEYSAIAFGPGLKIDSLYEKVFHHIERAFKKPVVIDAGGLPLIKKLKDNWLITPHEGELSKLLQVPCSEIHANRKKYIKLAQEKYGGIIVLKGPHTLIATDHLIYEIQTGNKALAKAGTGDVLTGMIVGLLSQGLEPADAAILAVGLHGHMADGWVKEKDYLSLMASDLIAELPRALFKLRKKT